MGSKSSNSNKKSEIKSTNFKSKHNDDKIEESRSRKTSLESKWGKNPYDCNLNFVSKNYETKLLDQTIASMSFNLNENDHSIQFNQDLNLAKHKGGVSEEFKDEIADVSTRINTYATKSNLRTSTITDFSSEIQLNSNKHNYKIDGSLFRRRPSSEIQIRRKYYSTLQKKGLWDNPLEKSFNSIIIFDWDDTLMYSYEFFNAMNLENILLNRSNTILSSNERLVKSGSTGKLLQDKSNPSPKIKPLQNILEMSKSTNNLLKNVNDKNSTKLQQQSSYIDDLNDKKLDLAEVNRIRMYFMNKTKITKNIEEKVYSVLNKALSLGDVFIVTNASMNWLTYSAQVFFPHTFKDQFPKIKLISARDQFQHECHMSLWKQKTFNQIAKSYNKKKLTNIISIGDSEFEINAATEMTKLFNDPKITFCKTIKLKARPGLELLAKELDLIDSSILKINSQFKNVDIVVNKNKVKS